MRLPPATCVTAGSCSKLSAWPAARTSRRQQPPAPPLPSAGRSREHGLPARGNAKPQPTNHALPSPRLRFSRCAAAAAALPPPLPPLQVRDMRFINCDNGVLVAGSDRVTVRGFEVAVSRNRGGGPENGEGHWGARVGEQAAPAAFQGSPSQPASRLCPACMLPCLPVASCSTAAAAAHSQSFCAHHLPLPSLSSPARHLH